MAESAIPVSRLTIEIGASSSNAVSEINKLSTALKNLRSSASGKTGNFSKMAEQLREVANAAHGMEDSVGALAKAASALERLSNLKSISLPKSLGDSIRNIGLAAESVKPESVVTIDSMTRSLQRMANVNFEGFKVLNGFSLPEIPATAGEAITSIAEAAGKVSAEQLQNLEKFTASLRGLENVDLSGVLAALLKINAKNTRIKVDTKDVDKANKKVGLLANALNSLTRIAFYRVIRSAIKAVGEALSEGAENAYWYSKTMGDSTKYIADAYDSLASGGFKMQNQLGAAWATLKATITPILLEIVRLVTMAANALTQFFAILGGKGQYLKAIDYSKQWADTTARGAGAAKEWKNQLMGFDEINRLEEPSKGGGGGGSALPDYSNMFEESEISEWAKKVQEHLEAIKTLAKDIGLAILGWNAGTFLGQIPGIGAGLKYIVGLVMFVYGTIDFIKGYIDAWENGITFENLAKQIGDATIAVVGLGLAFGTTGASIGGLIFGAAMVIGALHDLAVNGKLTNEAFAALSVGIMAVGVTLGILTKSWILPLIAAIATVSLTIHHFWDNISGWLTGLADKLRESGHNALAGFVEAFVEWGDNAHKWVDEHIVTPFVTWLKTLLGIHSPSTVMESIGDNLIQGLWNGIEEKWKDFIGFFEGLWNELKSWWEGLSLGAFHIPSPHFEWTYTQASGNIAKALEFVGLPATIPNLNISWYAKGGIVDGATLIGAGEAGKEAIIPLERNTEWIGKVAAELNAQQARQASPNGDIGAALEDANDGVINAIFAVGAQVVQAIADNAGGGEIDWRQVSQQVTKYQRQFSRAYG